MRQMRMWRRALRLALVASIALTGIWLLAGAAQAQSDSESSQSPDHYYFQFYGNARDVTIDGEALQEGDSVTPILNGEAVKPAQVQDNGFFLTFRHDVSKPAIGDCKVVYLVRSQRHQHPIATDEFTYPKGCGDIQVRLTLSTADASSSDAVAEAQQIEAEEDVATPEESEDTMQSEAQQSSPTQQEESDSQEDLMEEESEADEVDQSAGTSETDASPERQRPNAPRTGSGGLNSERTETNWSLVAGTIVLLGAMITGAMLMMRRRKDQSPR